MKVGLSIRGAVAAAILLAHSTGGPAHGADWPQFLGPERNGTASEAVAVAPWAGDGPRKVWERRVGAGYSGPVVTGERVLLFHRQNDEDVLECFRRKDGETLWRAAYPATYRDGFGHHDGPRATAAIEQGRVVTLGAAGDIFCVELETGKALWRVPAQRAYGVDTGFFGLACSPLVREGRIYLNLGGEEAGVVALDLEDGSLIWKATDDDASYSSPVWAELGGEKAVVFFTRWGLRVVDPEDGTVRWDKAWRSRMNASVNAATPLVWEDRIFVSACYGVGAGLFRVVGERLQMEWSDGDTMSNHYATCVRDGELLFGLHDRVDFPPGPALRCVEWKTGKVRWSEDGFGDANLIQSGGVLVVLREVGELLLVRADRAKFEVLARAHVLPSGARAAPALADGRLYARARDRVVCLDLTGAGDSGL